jgi:hypothetical protein
MQIGDGFLPRLLGAEGIEQGVVNGFHRVLTKGKPPALPGDS